jgi:HAE1 family hydrophobic/amphiphilic exporter-1
MLRALIQRPIALSMAFLALILLGVLSYRRLPVDLLPSITYPRLTVVTSYRDTPADDLERMVTQPIEEVVTALSRVRRVFSRTREGVSVVTVEYEWGTQMDFASLHLREAVDRVAFRDDFPQSAERPTILRWDPLSRPISILTLEAGHRPEAVTEFAREVVKPALQQVEGVSQAEVVGGAEREILVEPDVRKMAIYGVTVENIQTALARSNVTFPGGKIRQGPLHLSLRISGEYESLEDIAATDILRVGESPVRVGDVARVADTVKEPQGATLLGDDNVVSLFVYKEPEANTIRVSREVDRSLEVLRKDYGDFRYRFVYRDADYVEASFQGLLQSLILGSILAFLVLFVFLRDWRSPIVVGVSIPVCIIITFALLYLCGVKLNLMSLGGLSLAAGLLVDNGIVVLENVHRHLANEGARLSSRLESLDKVERRRSVAACSVAGTTEMARAVFATTLTTVAVFFPVVYVPGVAGAFFRDQALTVTISLLVSIATALLLQPMLSAYLLDHPRGEPRGMFRVFNALYERFDRFYHGLLIRALRRPGLMMVGLIVGLAAVFALGSRLPRSFMPERSSGDLRVQLEMPAGTPLEETTSTVASLARAVEVDPDVETVFTQVGQVEQTLASFQEYAGPNTARMRIMLRPTRGSAERGLRVREDLARRLDAMSGLSYGFFEEGIGLREILSTDEASFSIGIVSEDPHIAFEVAAELAERLGERGAVADPQVDRVIGTTNVVVHLDAEEIARRGLDPDQVARELRNRIAGVEATTFNEVDQRIDIAVRAPRDERRDLATVLDAPLRLASGETVPLRAVVDLSEERPLRELSRRDQQRMVSISADLQGASAEDAWRNAEQIAAGMNLPAGVRLVEGSQRREMLKSFRDLAWALLLATVLVYMILAAQFESFIDPLLIAAVIPIGIAGAILAMAVSGGSVNVLSMIGVVTLLGIAVDNAIIKIDAVRRLRDAGVDGYEAILAGSRLTLRPMLMTSATTILGLVPMAWGIGGGEQLQRPLALTIIGGLTLTTALTLFYTPLLYRVARGIRVPKP